MRRWGEILARQIGSSPLLPMCYLPHDIFSPSGRIQLPRDELQYQALFPRFSFSVDKSNLPSRSEYIAWDERGHPKIVTFLPKVICMPWQKLFASSLLISTVWYSGGGGKGDIYAREGVRDKNGTERENGSSTCSWSLSLFFGLSSDTIFNVTKTWVNMTQGKDIHFRQLQWEVHNKCQSRYYAITVLDNVLSTWASKVWLLEHSKLAACISRGGDTLRYPRPSPTFSSRELN